jgi:two-component system response regulator YesN
LYKIVIVDDEPNVRYGLRTYMEWSSLGIEVVGEAHDGDVALELIDRVRPDIVLTDVRMPKMDGITLSRKLREKYPHIVLIIISGHDDADYLKSAVKLNAVDYIFKPVSLSELKTVVTRSVRQLDEEGREQKLLDEMNAQLKQSMPLLREKFLMSLAHDGVADHKRIRDKLDFLGLKLPADGLYWGIVIRADQQHDDLRLRSEQDRQLLSYAILNICQELIGRHMEGYALERHSGEYVCVVYAERGENRVDRLFPLLEDIRENLQQWLKVSTTIGVGEQADNLSELPRSCKQAYDAADQKWWMGNNRIITMESLGNHDELPYRFGTTQSEQVTGALKSGDPERLEEVLNAVFAALTRNRREGLEYCRIICLELMLLANRLLLELNVQLHDLERKEARLRENIFSEDEIDGLKQYVFDYMQDVCVRIGDKRSRKSNNIVERIRGIMEQRFADNLTVAEIAREVYLTSTYVSLLFKQETGETINEALVKIRIERAKEMLRNPSVKFYDVCFAVGYADPSHFSKLFKKYTGYTPSSYRA